MNTQAHDSSKAASNATSTPRSSQFQTRPFDQASVNSAFAPVTNQFQSRPFAAPVPSPQSSSQQAPPDIQAQLEQAKRFNYDLSEINLFSTGTTPPEPPSSPGIQRKLTIGKPGDKYEQEADSVAAQVMSMSAAPPQSRSIQRQGDEEEQEPLVQRTPLADSITPLVQRQHIETAVQPKCSQCEQEEQVQTKPSLQRAATGKIDGGGELENQLNSSKGGGNSLPDQVRSFMEPRFGADFSSVRVHTGGEAVQMSKELGAQAFTHGSDVYFGEGKSPGNNELTAHELTHVVQQTGMVQAESDDSALPLSSTPSNSSTTFTLNNTTREVHGATLSQVYDSMTNSGAREAASVKPELKPDPQYEYDENNKVTKAVITVKETKEMPKWAELDKQCQPIKDEWNRFYGVLDKHEDHHVAIDRKHYTDVHKQLVGKQKEAAWAKMDAVIEAADKENETYDTTTNHGLTEGTKINGAVQCGIEKVDVEPGTSGEASDNATPAITDTETGMMAKRSALTDISQPAQTIFPNTGLTPLSGEMPYLIQRDVTTPAPASGVTPPSPPPPGSPAPAPQNETDTGLVGVRIPLIPLHPGWGDKLTPVDINVDQTLFKIPVPELGSTLDASFGFSMKVELSARLNPIFMENVEVKMTKLTALAVGGSILLIPTLGPSALMAALGLGYFTGQGDLIVTGKVGIDAKISGYTKFALNAVGSKKLSLAEYKLGLDGGVGAELNAGLFDRTAFTLDNGHLTFKKGNKLFLSPQLQAYLEAYIETSFLVGLISGRLSKKWNYKKGWDFAWKPEGGIDIDYDNGLRAKSLDKVFDIDPEKIKSLAKKTGAAVDFLKKLMEDGEQPGEIKDDEKKGNEEDKRTLEQKEAALNKAILESETLLKRPDATPQFIVSQFPTIKRNHGLTLIKLVHVSTNSSDYYVEAEINPKLKTREFKLNDKQEKKAPKRGDHIFNNSLKQAMPELLKIVSGKELRQSTRERLIKAINSSRDLLNSNVFDAIVNKDIDRTPEGDPNSTDNGTQKIQFILQFETFCSAILLQQEKNDDLGSRQIASARQNLLLNLHNWLEGSIDKEAEHLGDRTQINEGRKILSQVENTLRQAFLSV